MFSCWSYIVLTFWNVGYRYWCLDSTGILYVLPVSTVWKTLTASKGCVLMQLHTEFDMTYW